MRVITGMARGRALKTLDGLHTRPTAGKVKEAMFSILHFDLEGRRVLDLFAGSGQLGIEALSRGARECVFVDNDRAAVAIVRDNVKKCGFEAQSQVIQGDYAGYLKRGEKFDIILVDPPYADKLWKRTLEIAARFDTLNFGGIIVVESEADDALPERVGKLVRGRVYGYGRTKLTVYTRSEEEDADDGDIPGQL